VIGWLGLDFYSVGQTFFIRDVDGVEGWLEVAAGCTCVKQCIFWVFLMVLFPGWNRWKVGYILVGVVVLQVASVVRITGLALVLSTRPVWFDFFHDYIFKAMMYGVVFMLWLVWVELILPSSPVKVKAQSTT